MLVSRISIRRSTSVICRAQHSTTTHTHVSFPKLAPVGDHDIAHFAKILSPSSIITTLPPISSPQEELDPYNTDWIGRFRGRSTTVLKPKTTQEVSEILKWCNERRIGVVPQGGNTGLVGGSVPVNDEVILSLSNMNKVRSFDEVSGYYPRHVFHVARIHSLEQEYWLQTLAAFFSR